MQLHRLIHVPRNITTAIDSTGNDAGRRDTTSLSIQQLRQNKTGKFFSVEEFKNVLLVRNTGSILKIRSNSNSPTLVTHFFSLSLTGADIWDFIVRACCTCRTGAVLGADTAQLKLAQAQLWKPFTTLTLHSERL